MMCTQRTARVVNSVTGITNVSFALFIQCSISIFAPPSGIQRHTSKKRVEVGFWGHILLLNDATLYAEMLYIYHDTISRNSPQIPPTLRYTRRHTRTRTHTIRLFAPICCCCCCHWLLLLFVYLIVSHFSANCGIAKRSRSGME